MHIVSAPFPATRHKVKVGKKFLRETCEDIEIGFNGFTIIIPKGFETDFATIPRFLWGILSPWGRDELAFVVHDWLYANANKYDFSRAFCDKAMYTLQGQLWASEWRSEIMFLGIRLFGFYRFYKLNKRFR